MTPVRRPIPAPAGRMSDPTEAQLNRGFILAALATIYPHGAAESALKGELAEVWGNMSGWPAHVAYLTERGLIRVEERVLGPAYGGGVRLRDLALTADGLNQVDGTVDRDPGVAFADQF